MKTLRRYIVPTAITGLLVAGVWVSACRPARHAPARVPAVGASLVPAAPLRSEAPVREEPALRVERTTLGRGGTLDGALRTLGIPDDVRPAVIREVGRFVRLDRLPAATGIALGTEAGGAPRVVACRASAERFVRVALAGEGAPRAEEVVVPVATSREVFGGVVETSVAQALSAHAHAATLTSEFADIFQWDVDLLVDPRPGDRVGLVFESLRLAEPPADLPSFGPIGIDEGTDLGVGRVLAARYEGSRARSSAYWIENEIDGGNYYDEQGRSMRKTFLKSPLNYRRISSGFTNARRHPITRRVVPHHGVDFAAPAGTPVVAAADGRVVSVGWEGALGKAIRIRHGDGYETVYGHLRSYHRGIRPGSRVLQDQTIGYVGATGRATGPHLHYSMIRRGRAINPMTFRNPPTSPLDPSRRPRLETAIRDLKPMLLSVPEETVAARNDARSGKASG